MGLNEHLNLFPMRIRTALLSYKDWDGVSEIRLRRGLPLSLTHFKGNLFLDENGRLCGADRALRLREEELRSFVCAFCGGSVYRYFDTMKEGFLVDEEGYRLGVCPEKNLLISHVPERFEGANLRIPRFIKGAAKELLALFHEKPLASTLFLSPPGAGKTTLLRDLAITLSCGDESHKAMRVAVVDERRELFPELFLKKAGLCDVLSGYGKKEGLEIATRLFAPEAVFCDEIGGKEDADALLQAGGAGCLLFASAHGASAEEAKSRPFLRSLLESGLFSYLAVLTRVPGDVFRVKIRLQEVT